MYTAETIQEMRNWAYDCAIDREDLLNMRRASDESIIRWVSKNYDGGIDAFLKNI